VTEVDQRQRLGDQSATVLRLAGDQVRTGQADQVEYPVAGLGRVALPM
jgi:hypothetical protein